MTDLQQQIGRLLLVLSYARRHPDALVPDIARAVGVTTEVLREELLPLLTLVGKPPFSPGDLVDLWLDGQQRLHVELDQSLGRPLRLTVGESLALKVALEAFASSGAGDYAARARTLIQRLSSLFTSGGAPGEGRVAVAAPPAEPAFAVLDQGVREHRRVEMVYYTASRDALGTRVVEPWALIEVADAWYAVARDAEAGEPRIFKLERVQRATLLDDTFVPPADFDPRVFVAGGRFVGAGGRNLRVAVPLSLVEPLVEEGYVVDREANRAVVTVPFAEARWAAAWVMALGDGVVIEPDEVRALVAARCREALALYDGPQEGEA